MDCQDVRLLLAFQRRAEAVEAAERQALRRHLETCPDCAAFVQSEEATDRALGAALRDVPVPPELQARLLERLADARKPRWRWVAASAAAAAVLLLTLGLVGYSFLRPRPVDLDAFAYAVDGQARNAPEQVEQWFAEAGLPMKFPPNFNDRYLLSYDIVQFQGRSVPKLVFFREGDRCAVAQVLVLDENRFLVSDESGRPVDAMQPIARTTYNVWPMQGQDSVYLVYYTSATLDPFQKQGEF